MTTPDVPQLRPRRRTSTCGAASRSSSSTTSTSTSAICTCCKDIDTDRQPRRGRRRHRSVRVGQVDALPRDQPARDDRLRHDHDRRQAAARRRARAWPTLRADVGMVFQSFNLFAHKTVLENVTLGPIKVRKMSRRRTPSARRWRCSTASVSRNQAEEDAGPALRRPAAARRDRPRARDGSQGHAVRRADQRARPRDDQRGARRHGRPRQRRHDHDRRHPRDGLRAQGRRPRASSWPTAQIVEEATPEQFFTNPQSERAKDFLSKILEH